MFPSEAPSTIKVIQTLWKPWWVYVIAIGLVVVLTPIIRGLANRWKIYDLPEGLLKTHKKPIPYLGGVAIFIAWIVPVLIWAITSGNQYIRQVAAICIGGAVLVLLGLADDLKDIKPKYRLLGEVAVAVGLFAAGLQFKAIPQITVGGLTFFAEGSLGFVAVGLLVQIMLITGASNAINLLDGLDGLCSGVIAIIAVGFLLVATHIGAWAIPQWCADVVGPEYQFNELVIVLAMVLAGTVLGFLLYNSIPATIFLGDAGSTFLGYLAAVFMILFADKPGMTKWFLACLMIMGLPIFDTGLALVRRLRNKRRIFGGDRSHFYDQLVDRGLSVRTTVMVCYGLAVLTVAIGVGTLALRTRHMAAIYAVILVAVSVFAVVGKFIKVDDSSAGKA